jgi:glycosyltransferase involved in cell wall biosynthesis
MNALPLVLMIAYYFPPMGGAGVQRTLKFVKYLPEYGWQPHVLTVRNKPSLQDPSLEREILEGVAVTRTPILRLPPRLPWRVRNFIARWLLIVDEQVGWLPYAKPARRKVIEQQGVEAIYSTSAPFSAHLIARDLHQQTRLPWVADFRDPWTGNSLVNFPTRFHRNLSKRLERSVFTSADRVILNTSGAWRYYTREYPDLAAKKLVIIPNGYDQDDIRITDSVKENDKRFTIVHLGSLYPKTRSSEFFLMALDKAIESGRLPKDETRVYFIGNIDRETQDKVKHLNLGENIELIDYLPHQEALKQIATANVLLLIASYGAGSDLFVPAKLYEYLACGKPILCLADPGECAEIILKARAGVIVPPTNVEKIADQLVSLYQAWQNGQLSIEPDRALIQSFERRQLTRQLAGIFDEITGRIV